MGVLEMARSVRLSVSFTCRLRSYCPPPGWIVSVRLYCPTCMSCSATVVSLDISFGRKQPSATSCCFVNVPYHPRVVDRHILLFSITSIVPDPLWRDISHSNKGKTNGSDTCLLSPSGVQTRVCKEFFLATLDIGKKTVDDALNNKQCMGFSKENMKEDIIERLTISRHVTHCYQLSTLVCLVLFCCCLLHCDKIHLSPVSETMRCKVFYTKQRRHNYLFVT